MVVLDTSKDKEFTRWWICIWGVILLLNVFSLSANADSSFTDVKTSHPNYADIMRMKEQGFINGYPDGTFRPQAQISRKHVAKLLNDVVKLPAPQSEKQVYKDLPKSHPYFVPIMKLTEAGIFSGGLEGKFNPDAPMTRIQMAKVLDLAFGFQMKTHFAFADVQLFHWGYPHANALFSHGVARGSDGMFFPNQPVTRAHYAAFLQRSVDAAKSIQKADLLKKDDVWDLANRLPLALETVLLQGKESNQPFSKIQNQLKLYATDAFIADLREYYPHVCTACDVLTFPTLIAEPVARFDFKQTGNTLTLHTIELGGGPTAGGEVDYIFKKVNGKWKIDSYMFTLVSADHFNLTIDEAKKILTYFYSDPSQKPARVTYKFSNSETASDYVTEEIYEYEEYIFTIETSNNSFDVYFASNDGRFEEY